MMNILLTVDTELSAGLHQQGVSPVDNFNSSILGRCDAGEVGIVHQMQRLDEYGHKAIFFIDPMPALVYGEQIVADMVGPVVERGHEVQLHLHTEWLQWAKDSPVDGRQGRNLADYSMEDQRILVKVARDLLTDAGGPPPTAFRAGNFGANDESLRAISDAKITWDSSFTPCSAIKDCDIDLPHSQIAPVSINGIIEMPVSGIMTGPDHIRPAQICALSTAEMAAAMTHASGDGHPAFVIVTHSFELLSRDRSRINQSVVKRFENIAAYVAKHPQLQMSGFDQLPADNLLNGEGNFKRLGPNKFRSTMRIAEQLWGTWRYENSIKPG